MSMTPLHAPVHTQAGLPLLLCAVLFICLVGATGCGDATSHTSAGDHGTASHPPRPSTRPSQRLKADGDGDGDNNDDEYDIRRYGHAANAADRRAIATVIERYHAATAAEDGSKACPLLTAALAKAMAGQASSEGVASRACEEAVTKLLTQLAGHSDANLPTIDVTLVRVRRGEARAMVRLPSGEERYVPLTRQADAWKVAALFDIGTI
jgi:hypothetical protein